MVCGGFGRVLAPGLAASASYRSPHGRPFGDDVAADFGLFGAVLQKSLPGSQAGGSALHDEPRSPGKMKFHTFNKIKLNKFISNAISVSFACTATHRGIARAAAEPLY